MVNITAVRMVIASLVVQAALGSFNLKSEFAIKNRCLVASRTRHEEGFGVYKEERIKCANIHPSEFSYATCFKRCRQPLTRRHLSPKKYENVAVKVYQTFTQRAGDVAVPLQMLIPIACRCVAKKNFRRKNNFINHKKNAMM